MLSNLVALLSHRHLIESGTVDTKCPADGHGTASLLVHVCEDGLFAFAKVLLENGADVGVVLCSGYGRVCGLCCQS